MIVGAGAVVGGTIAPDTIVVGNPARPVRRRFADAVIATLLDLALRNWPCGTGLAELALRNWPTDPVKTALPALLHADLDRLQALRP